MKDITEATDDGDLALVTQLLAANPECINIRGPFMGFSALCNAVCLPSSPHRLEILKTLIATPNINVNQPNDMGDTPLLLAVRNSFVEGMLLLLAAGADPNKANNKGWTSLHQAVSRPDPLEIIAQLVRAGADVTLQTDEGKTAADFCRTGKRVALAQILCDATLLNMARSPADYRAEISSRILKLQEDTNQERTGIALLRAINEVKTKTELNQWLTLCAKELERIDSLASVSACSHKALTQ